MNFATLRHPEIRDIFDISDYRAIIIITRWKDSTERFETEKKLCVD